MAGYTPKYGSPGMEPEHVGSRNRRRRPTRARRANPPAAIASIPKDRISMTGYAPKYGPPGTEPEHVGSRKKGQRRPRAPSPEPSIDQQISTQTSTLQISANSASPKTAIPPVVLATKSLNMKKQQKAWKKAYIARLTVSNADLLPHEVADMVHEAWEQHAPALRHKVTAAAAERKGARWRKKQMKVNPSFLGQRASRLTQLYNEVREMNPILSWEDVMAQAKGLEKREVIAAAERELLEKKKARYLAKEKRKDDAAKVEKAMADQRRANQNQISNYFARVEKTQIEEDSRDEDDYEPPESFEQPRERLNAASPSRKQRLEQRLQEFKVLAAHEQAQWKTTQHEEALRAEAARHEARMGEVQRNEERRDEERRANALIHEARKEEARRNRIRMEEAQAARRAEAEARAEGARQAEALRRERLYQAAVKSQNMERWLQQLARDEPEAPEEMQDVPEEMEESDEMEVSEDMQDDPDEIQLS